MPRTGLKNSTSVPRLVVISAFLQHTTLLHALHDNRKGRTLSPGLTRLELELFRIGFSVRLGDRPDSRALAFGWGLASRTRRSG
uniref:Uncharacterized protein n=1 Tax=mine drainage metagenome TaxID=410659 RepID=E6Q5Y3_9ZZZZ